MFDLTNLQDLLNEAEKSKSPRANQVAKEAEPEVKDKAEVKTESEPKVEQKTEKPDPKAADKPIKKTGDPQPKDFEDEEEEQEASFPFEDNIGILFDVNQNGTALVIFVSKQDGRGVILPNYTEDRTPTFNLEPLKPVKFDITYRKPGKKGLSPVNLKAINVKYLEGNAGVELLCEKLGKMLSFMESESSKTISLRAEQVAALIIQSYVKRPQPFQEEKPNKMVDGLLEFGYMFVGHDPRAPQDRNFIFQVDSQEK